MCCGRGTFPRRSRSRSTTPSATVPGTFQAFIANFNVSFAKGLLALPDAIKAQEAGGKVPDGFLAAPRSLIGYAILLLVVVALLVLGRRIAPVMAGIVLLATASLFPALSLPYYLVFALPVAALVVRDPDGPPGTGIFDRFAAMGDRRRAVGVLVSLAAALSIAQIALPSPPVKAADITGQRTALGSSTRTVVVTTVPLCRCSGWLPAWRSSFPTRGDRLAHLRLTPPAAMTSVTAMTAVPAMRRRPPTKIPQTPPSAIRPCRKR